MPTVKWKVPQLLQGSSHGLQAAPAARPATVAEAAQPKVVASMLADGVMKSQRFKAAEPRRGMGGARASAQAPLLESVELTPGGRRRHTLQRMSPGGTTRTAQYTSPSKAEVTSVAGDSDNELVQDELEMESWRRRGVAVEEVACQQTGAQRSAASRAKRKAEEPLTPSAWLPSDAVLPDDVILSVDESAAKHQYAQKRYAAMC
mmetsp:Transcript_57107/g.113434  ORF Transcript_57107/g.113434 Transcript_57107/m.113434 type:complete len:204 (-) Transcript_57107:152-763(-)